MSDRDRILLKRIEEKLDEALVLLRGAPARKGSWPVTVFQVPPMDNETDMVIGPSLLWDTGTSGSPIVDSDLPGVP